MDENQAHAEKMKAMQAEHRRKIRSVKDVDRGLVLVHTGDGKGKSSSAFGVIARALGWGHDVAVVQFIKGNWETGERQFFEGFPDQLVWHTMGEGFTWDTQDRERDIATAQAAFAKAKELLGGGAYDLVVLDEIIVAMQYDYLDTSEVIAGLEERATRSSVILTGRGAKPALIEYADLVSEMGEIKHPFQAGIKARQGIDF